MHANPNGAARACAVVLSGLAFLAVAAIPANAQDPNDITLRLSATTGNPGDSVEVSVALETDDIFPETFAVFLAYDGAALEPLPEAFEIIARNEFTGEPLVDNDGNTIADFSLVRLSDAVVDAGKLATFETYTDAEAVGVLVHGLNQEPIPEGVVFTLAFRILETVPDGSMTDILGLDDASDIHVPDGDGGVSRLVSSFTRTVPAESGGTNVELLTYGFENTVVIVGCIPAAAPSGVSASQDQSDAVVVSWNAVAGSNIEYRVYRGTTSSAIGAVPIGEGWQTATTFSDITALVPEVDQGDCFNPGQVSEVHYFYWVRARSQEGCESDLSATPAEGFRVRAAKSAVASLFPVPGSAEGLLVYGLALMCLIGVRRMRHGRV